LFVKIGVITSDIPLSIGVTRVASAVETMESTGKIHSTDRGQGSLCFTASGEGTTCHTFIRNKDGSFIDAILHFGL
jgi:hypothetical protein